MATKAGLFLLADRAGAYFQVLLRALKISEYGIDTLKR